MKMELFRLGPVPWQDSQLIYHALARLGREALVLLSPKSPYVCIGYHQDAVEEVDLDFCRKEQIPVFRREVGGGAVYLDRGQLFYQLILKGHHPLAGVKKEIFFRRILQPVVAVFHRLGIPVEYKPINDILVGGRKISGNGAGEIGDCLVMVGNLIFDFDFETMSRVLKTPDEKFRGKIYKTLKENLTTVHQEMGKQAYSKWCDNDVCDLLREEFRKILGEFTPGVVDRHLTEEVKRQTARMLDAKWLHWIKRRKGQREIKIRDGVKVVHRVHKAAGGLLRASYRICDGRFEDLMISGDFFCYPRHVVENLSLRLAGERVNNLKAVLKGMCEDRSVEVTGVRMDDWLSLLGEGPDNPDRIIRTDNPDQTIRIGQSE